MKKKIRKLHIKKGDTVIVLSGDDKRKTGRVLKIFPKKRMAIVEGVNMKVKHMKPNDDNPQGGKVTSEAPVNISKFMLVEPKTNKPTRIGRIKNENGKGWLRVSKKTGEIIS